MSGRYSRRVRARALGLLAGWRAAGVRPAVRPGRAEVLASEAGALLAFRRSVEWVPLARVALEVARKLDSDDTWRAKVAAAPGILSPGGHAAPHATPQPNPKESTR